MNRVDQKYRLGTEADKGLQQILRGLAAVENWELALLLQPVEDFRTGRVVPGQPVAHRNNDARRPQ
jgi:hypothetical protein